MGFPFGVWLHDSHSHMPKIFYSQRHTITFKVFTISFITWDHKNEGELNIKVMLILLAIWCIVLSYHQWKILKNYAKNLISRDTSYISDKLHMFIKFLAISNPPDKWVQGDLNLACKRVQATCIILFWLQFDQINHHTIKSRSDVDSVGFEPCW